MPIAEAKPKTETIIKDIQLKQLDQLIFEAYLDKLINDDSNGAGSNGYSDSWLYFDVDVRDRASESVVISQEKISIIGPVQINTKDFSDTSLQAPGHIPTNTYDILNTAANILKDSGRLSHESRYAGLRQHQSMRVAELIAPEAREVVAPGVVGA